MLTTYIYLRFITYLQQYYTIVLYTYTSHTQPKHRAAHRQSASRSARLLPSRDLLPPGSTATTVAF